MQRSNAVYCKIKLKIKLLAICGFLLIHPLNLYAQNSSEQDQFPEIISEPEEILNSSTIPSGTLILNRLGFIECRGSLFLDEPPKGKDIEIIYENISYTNSGLWNNTITKEISNLEYDDKETIFLAQQKFQAGLKSDPLFFAFMYNSSILFLLADKPDETLNLLKKSESLIPDFAGINIIKSRAYEMKKEYFAANNELKKAAKKSPFSMEPLLMLGFMNLNADMLSKSEYYFDYLLNINKENIEAKIGKVGILLHKNKHSDAKRELSKLEASNSYRLLNNKYSFLYHEYKIQLYEKDRLYNKAVEEINILLALDNPVYFLNHSRNDLLKYQNKLKKLSAMDSKVN